MRLVAYSIVALAIVCVPAEGSAPPSGATGAVATTWRTFVSHSGWSIEYPAAWQVSSCVSCSDPSAPGVFVNFRPPISTATTDVMVEPLAGKPAAQSAMQWLEEVKSEANLNPIIAEHRVLLSGFSGLQVRYKNTSTDTEMESTYFVFGSKTYAVEFDTDAKGGALEGLSGYALYKHMIKSFKIKDVR